jgi:2',3'-cyclic-nucleotide 2'-phosphodiesterase (5'-nucleotidase family)
MMMKISLFSVALISAFCVVQGQVQLSLIHFNDFHARYEPTSGGGGSCKPGANEQGAYAFNYQ